MIELPELRTVCDRSIQFNYPSGPDLVGAYTSFTLNMKLTQGQYYKLFDPNRTIQFLNIIDFSLDITINKNDRKRKSVTNLKQQDIYGIKLIGTYLAGSIIVISFWVALISLISLSYAAFKDGRPVYEKQFQYTICNDGSISHSKGQGSCSYHRGVKLYVYEDVFIGIYKPNYSNKLLWFLPSITILIVFSLLSREFYLAIKELINNFEYFAYLIITVFFMLLIIIVKSIIKFYIFVTPKK